jgi:hypothetical protein
MVFASKNFSNYKISSHQLAQLGSLRGKNDGSDRSGRACIHFYNACTLYGPNTSLSWTMDLWAIANAFTLCGSGCDSGGAGNGGVVGRLVVYRRRRQYVDLPQFGRGA